MRGDRREGQQKGEGVGMERRTREEGQGMKEERSDIGGGGEEGGATGNRGGRRAGSGGAKGKVGQVGWMFGWDSAVDVGQGWSTVGVEREILVVRMSDTLVRKGVPMVGKAMNLWMMRMHDSVEAVRQNTDHVTHHNELWIHINVLNAI